MKSNKISRNIETHVETSLSQTKNGGTSMDKLDQIKKLQDKNCKLKKETDQLNEVHRTQKIENLEFQIKEISKEITTLNSGIDFVKRELKKVVISTPSKKHTKLKSSSLTEEERISHLESKNKQLEKKNDLIRIACIQERIDNLKRQRTALKKRLKTLKRQKSSSK